MVLTRKDFVVLAEMCGSIVSDSDREVVKDFLIRFCKQHNERFDTEKFRDWIDKVRD